MNTISYTRELALYTQNPPEASGQESRASQYVERTDLARGPVEDRVSIAPNAEEEARKYARARLVPPWFGPEYVLRYNNRGEGISVDPRTGRPDSGVDFYI